MEGLEGQSSYGVVAKTKSVEEHGGGGKRQGDGGKGKGGKGQGDVGKGKGGDAKGPGGGKGHGTKGGGVTKKRGGRGRRGKGYGNVVSSALLLFYRGILVIFHLFYTGFHAEGHKY